MNQFSDTPAGVHVANGGRRLLFFRLFRVFRGLYLLSRSVVPSSVYEMRNVKLFLRGPIALHRRCACRQLLQRRPLGDAC